MGGERIMEVSVLHIKRISFDFRVKGNALIGFNTLSFGFVIGALWIFGELGQFQGLGPLARLVGACGLGPFGRAALGQLPL